MIVKGFLLNTYKISTVNTKTTAKTDNLKVYLCHKAAKITNNKTLIAN